jgi:ribosomal protein S18 acetylase RimI-like enzyme
LQFRIRRCERSDCAEILALWKRAEATPSTTDSIDELKRLLGEPQAIVLVATDADGRIVGSVIGGWDGWRGNIYRLAVAPEARRYGIAVALVCEVSDHLEREKGARRITALVEKAHPDAVGFWESNEKSHHGFSLDPRIVRYVRTAGR